MEELNQLCKDTDSVISQLAIVSMTEVFKDIIPGYRIRLPTEAERNNKVWGVDVVSMTEVFKDIIPGYRIRLPTEAERNNKV